MRYTQLFTQTLREAPVEAETASHTLALRAGLIRPVAAGIFSYLPLGLRVKQKIERILREEMAAIGCSEILMPVVLPGELWEKSGRWESVGPELLRMKDRSGRDLCLAMTHEEAVADLARTLIQSYRQLPMQVFHIQTKFRDEPRSRGGLIRVREFTMKDAYSFHLRPECLDRTYRRMHGAYERIFERAGLEVISVESDTGMMGGTGAHEFIYPSPAGEDTILLCDDYRANRQIARFKKEPPEGEPPRPLEEVETPACTTIADLAAFLGIPESRTAKAVFYTGKIDGAPRFIFAVVRGDHELNEAKLAAATGALDLQPATEAEIRAIGAEPGYGSPVGVAEDALIVVDDLVAASPNLVAGANREGFHYRNVNAGRDYAPDKVADLVSAQEGYPCPECGAPLRSVRGIEVGNIFKLGTRYGERLEAMAQDEAGRLRPLLMGSYGIGVGRLLACIVEAHHDDRGICWPMAVAPFQVHIVVLGGKQPAGEGEAAEGLCRELEEAGVEVLLDDRDERAGVKFNDADLIGIPLRVTVGARGLANGEVELKKRTEEDREQVALGDVVARVRAEIPAGST